MDRRTFIGGVAVASVLFSVLGYFASVLSAVFFGGLSELACLDGKSVSFEFRFDDYKKLPTVATELVRQRMIFAAGFTTAAVDRPAP